MKLHREQFLAAAMMLSAAQSLGACRSKPDAGNEGINPEETQNIGQNGPNGAIGQDLGAAPNRAGQPVGAKVVVPNREAGVAVPVREVPAFTVPNREAPGVAVPVKEAPVLAAPNREAPVVTSPTNEKILATPTREAPFVPPRTTAPAKTVTSPPIVTPRK